MNIKKILKKSKRNAGGFIFWTFLKMSIFQNMDQTFSKKAFYTVHAVK